MHGRGIEGDQELRDISRQLAAGVLRAVFTYQRHIHATGRALTWKSLITDMLVCHRNDQEMVGIPDLSDLLPHR